MIDKLADAVVERLCRAGTVTPENRDIYVFGVSGLIKTFGNMVIPVILGLLFGCVVQVLVFLASYCLLRRFAGGYHAKTELVCFILSQVMVVSVVALLFFYTYIPVVLHAVVAVLSAICIFVLAPVEAENNPLNDVETAVYRKRSQLLCAAYLAAYVVGSFVSPVLSAPFFCALLVAAIHLLPGAQHSLLKRARCKKAG